MVTINLNPGRVIPPNFVGISEDHNDIADLVGQQGGGLNPAYHQLLKNLTMAGANPLSLRVEGDMMSPTDTLPGINGGVPNQPQSAILEPLGKLAEGVNVRLILGVDMASNRPDWAAAEVAAYLKAIPNVKIDAFEIGNEPDSYASQGHRPVGWGVNDYLSEWSAWRAGMVAAAKRPLALEGPAAAGSSYTAATLAGLASTYPAFIYGQHAYPYGKNAANAPDLLMQPAASLKTAGGYGKYVPMAGATPYRITEMNSVAGGGQDGISNAFQAALWLIDTAFELASVGMAGFNFHSGQYTDYNLWEFTASPKGPCRQLMSVNAPYYAMLALCGLMGNGARLLSVTASGLKVWATIDAINTVRVVLINYSSQPISAPVTIPAYKSCTAKLLTAPGYDSKMGISYGGQTFDGSTDGTIQGKSVRWPVLFGKGVFTVNVPAASAIVLTVTP